MPGQDLDRHPPSGLLTSDPENLADRAIRAWTLFAETVAEVDLDGRTRSRSRRAREMVTALGTWPDSRGIPELLADGRAGATSTEPMKQAARRLAKAHADASDDEVRASIDASLQQTAEWLRGGGLHTEGLLGTPSPLGVLPMGTVVHAATYQLAVTARDLIPAGAPIQPELDEIGMVALIDAAGAVAARTGLDVGAVAVGQRSTATIDVADNAWTTTFVDDERHPAVIAPEEVLLDMAGGRADLAAATRQLRFRDPRGLLALAPIVDDIPELPGGPLLRRAARVVRLLGGLR